MNQPVSRNDPCPCRSGRKYKRCHGVAQEKPRVASVRANQLLKDQLPQHELITPDMQGRMTAAFQKVFSQLPTAQRTRLQAELQALKPPTTADEAQAYSQAASQLLPPDFMRLLFQEMGLAEDFMVPGTAESASGPELTEEAARKIVADAVAEGRITPEAGEALLKSNGVPSKG